MTLYRVWELILASNVPLPELRHVHGDEPDCAFQLLPGQGPGSAGCDWFHQQLLPDGEIWLSFARQGSGYLLRFPSLADFLVSGDGREIRCYPLSSIPLNTIRHLLLDHVIPLVMTMQRRVGLHGAAVVVPDGAIAFIGETGRGKSTLTGSFIQQGFPQLTDDCLFLKERGGQFFGLPSYPGLRLWPDVISALFGHEIELSQVTHYTEKKRLALDNAGLPFCPDLVPLRRAYVLAPPEEVGDRSSITMTPLFPRDALMELVKHAYRLDIADRQALGQEFEILARVAALLPLYRLSFPRDFSLLPAVRDAILADLKTGITSL